jgi:hypothetical protein
VVIQPAFRLITVHTYIEQILAARNAYRILALKLLQKLFLISHSKRWKNNTEVVSEDGRWMELAQDRVQWRALLLPVMNIWVLLLKLIKREGKSPLERSIKPILKKCWGGGEGLDWIHLAQDMIQWRGLVNTLMNLRFYKRQGIS